MSYIHIHSLQKRNTQVYIVQPLCYINLDLMKRPKIMLHLGQKSRHVWPERGHQLNTGYNKTQLAHLYSIHWIHPRNLKINPALEGGQWERGQVIEMRMRLRMRMRKSIPMTFTLAVLEDESPLLLTKNMNIGSNFHFPLQEIRGRPVGGCARVSTCVPAAHRR